MKLYIVKVLYRDTNEVEDIEIYADSAREAKYFIERDKYYASLFSVRIVSVKEKDEDYSSVSQAKEQR